MDTTPIPQKVDGRASPQIRETETEVHIIITDLMLHSQTPCNPSSFARGVQKAITNGKPGRAYYPDSLKRVNEGDTFEASMPLMDGLQEVIDKAAARGKKVRFFIPKSGIPVYLGKDAVEKIDALKRRGKL